MKILTFLLFFMLIEAKATQNNYETMPCEQLEKVVSENLKRVKGDVNLLTAEDRKLVNAMARNCAPYQIREAETNDVEKGLRSSEDELDILAALEEYDDAMGIGN